MTYRVSTMTCNGSVGTCVDLLKFYENLSLDHGFVWTEYRGKQTRGVYPKKQNGERKSFDNQVTVIYKMADGYYPNIKLFRNGSLQMTGIRSLEDGQRIVNEVAEEVRRIADENASDIVANPESIAGRDFCIRMINSDFALPYEIRRKELHRLVISNAYGNQCIFQPGLYPGVKLQYFYNTMNTQKDGICRCTDHCQGKGSGSGNHQCKKVTICIFESGKILITGSNAFEQIDQAYAYINAILRDNIEQLRKNAM